MTRAHHYPWSLVALHWLTLFLLIGVYTCMELREFWPKGDPIREGLKSWHYTLGLTVWVLTFIRLVLRATGPAAPQIFPPPPAWQALAARLVHLALYALLIAMPILGWTLLSAEGKTIPFWAGIELPALTAKNEGLAEFIEEIHETLAKAGYVLIGVHAVAALYHHYAQRDNTLRRMLPGPARP